MVTHGKPFKIKKLKKNSSYKTFNIQMARNIVFYEN